MRHFIILSTFTALALIGTLADGAAIVSSPYQLVSDTKQFNADLATFNDFLSSGPVLASSAKLLYDLDDGANTAEGSSPLSDAEAEELVEPTSQLVDLTLSALSSITAKKALLQSTGLIVTALPELEATKNASDRFESAVLAKTPADRQPAAEELTAPLDQAFEATIESLSS